MGTEWVIFVWIIAFFLLISLLVMIVYQLMCLADLEFDYINPYDSASRINYVVLPEFAVQGVLSLLFLLTGHWLMFLFSAPVLYYNLKLSAKLVWEKIKMEGYLQSWNPTTESILYGGWLEDNRNGNWSNQENAGELIAHTLWAIWINRCNQVFRDKNFESSYVAKQAVAMFNEKQSAMKSINDLEELAIREWNSTNFKYHIFVDASWRDGESNAGIGCIIVTNTGSFCFAGAKYCKAGSAYEGEVKAMKFGLKKLLQKGLDGVMMYTDNQFTPRWMTRSNENQEGTSSDQIKKCKNMMEKLKRCEIQLISRDYNNCADSIAKMARKERRDFDFEREDLIPTGMLDDYRKLQLFVLGSVQRCEQFE